MLLLGLFNFGKLTLKTGMLVSLNNLNNIRLYITVWFCVSSDMKSSSEICLFWFINNSALILKGICFKLIFIKLFYNVYKLFPFYHSLDPLFVLHMSNGN